MQETESLVMKGNITVPYKWTTGAATGRFLSELKNSKRIVGMKCEKCEKIYIPPTDICGECFVELKNFVEVGKCGTVNVFTVVHKDLPFKPCDPPYAIISVRLDGAGTDLLHIMKSEDIGGLKAGARVEAVFAENPQAQLMAIESFKPTKSPVDQSYPKPIEAFDAKPVMECSGKLTVPYEWSYGETLTRFFTTTRDKKQIMGTKCPKCNSVLVPPVKVCGRCFTQTLPEWIEVPDRGKIVSFTVVYLPFPGQPHEPPYCYGMIRLDGTNTQYPHMIKEIDFDKIEIGMRVQAVWNDERKGDLFDIKYFEPEGKRQ